MNTVNNKTYIGVHKTDKDDFDGYIGCGVNINRPATYKKSKTPFQYAVNKYGIDKFIRTTLFTFDNEEGKGAFWHTTSHIMAQAIKRLYPDTKLAIGPSIENGFYYDVDRETPFVAEDLEKIEL